MPAPRGVRNNHHKPNQPRSANAEARHGSSGNWWRVAVLVAAGALTYANSLSNPYVFDDEGTIIENEQIRNLWTADVLLPERELPVAGRPIVNITFAINYAIGGLNVAGYRVGNIAVHVLCAMLLFGIVRRTLQLPWASGRLTQHSTDVAFAAALLWTVHPLNSEVINYVTQRTESLMALFYLLTVYASLRALGTEGSPRWHVTAVLACALGMGSKESMATAPLSIFLFDRVFVYDSFGQAFRTRWRLYAGLALTWAILAGLMSTGPRRHSTGFSTGVTVWTYLLNQLKMITRYLGLVVWPRSLVANYGWPAPLSFGDVLPQAGLVGGLAALTIAALRWQPQVGFLLAWFFMTLAPTSSIVPISTEVGAERRMYLPLAALVALAAIGAVRVWDHFKARLPSAARHAAILPVAALSLFILTSAALAARTVARNREYRSWLALARVTLDRYPTPSAHHVLAEELLKVGNRPEAMTHLQQALPGAPRAHYTLALELYKDRRFDEAIREFRIFIREQPYLAHVVAAHGYIGTAYALRENWPEAIAAFREMLKVTPNNPQAERSLADALFAQQELAEAIVHYRAYLQAQPDDADALQSVGIALGSTGRLDEAVFAFRRAAAVDPQNGAVQRNLATALYAKQELAEAAAHAKLAVTLQPDDPGSRDLLARILERQRQLGQTQ